MTAEDAISLLRQRATAVHVRGQCVQSIVDRDEDPPGLFLPSGGKNTVFLKRGRGALGTFFTICHELGHFWGYATGRRTQAYCRALLRWQNWENDVRLAARNAEAVLLYPSASAAPADVFKKALDEARGELPCPLAGGEKQEISAEEARAWCFGYQVAARLPVTTSDAFVAEATSALAWYYQRLEMPGAAWTPTDSSCEMAEEDRRYIDELTTAG